MDSQICTKSLNWTQSRCSFSSISIQLALQTILKEVLKNQYQLIYDIPKLEQIVQAYLTIVNQFSLKFIKKAETDLYRFFEMIPLSSLDMIEYALQCLS